MLFIVQTYVLQIDNAIHGPQTKTYFTISLPSISRYLLELYGLCDLDLSWGALCVPLGIQGLQGIMVRYGKSYQVCNFTLIDKFGF